jgi:hypothetical protein
MTSAIKIKTLAKTGWNLDLASTKAKAKAARNAKRRAEYEAEIDRGRGGDKIIPAPSAEEAMLLAMEWARRGDWADVETKEWVEVRVRVAGSDDAWERDYFLVGPGADDDSVPAPSEYTSPDGTIAPL